MGLKKYKLECFKMMRKQREAENPRAFCRGFLHRFMINSVKLMKEKQYCDSEMSFIRQMQDKMHSCDLYTMTDKERIIKELQKIRKQGYAIDDEEIELGLKCVAAPIFNHDETVVAAISCAAPKARMGEERMPQVIEEIKQAAQKISESIGYKRGMISA
ncbi:UNVERIFIED_ORG: glyoxylate carboligase [Heyndrickxia coagulans]